MATYTTFNPFLKRVFVVAKVVNTLGDSGFFRLQGIVKAKVSGVFEDLKLKILNVRSSSTPKTIAFTIP